MKDQEDLSDNCSYEEQIICPVCLHRLWYHTTTLRTIDSAYYGSFENKIPQVLTSNITNYTFGPLDVGCIGIITHDKDSCRCQYYNDYMNWLDI